MGSAWNGLPTPPPTSCVTLGRGLGLSEPQTLPQFMGRMPSILGLLESFNTVMDGNMACSSRECRFLLAPTPEVLKEKSESEAYLPGEYSFLFSR